MPKKRRKRSSAAEPLLPQYPIYIPSKGRAGIHCLTPRFLARDGVPFKLVIEEQEHDDYAREHGEENLLVLPFRDRGSVIPARNWIKKHATESGAKRHWQLDDNIRRCRRWYRGKRVSCKAGPALRVTEEFVDRYENVAVAGLQYTMFCVAPRGKGMPPFYLNSKVYSCSLVLNELPYEWRGQYNEDTDYCLQVLADGWCTVTINAFMVDKIETMKLKGGNTSALYDKDDGRLRMAKSLERKWPYVVSTKRRFGRPQHVVRNSWRRFDNKLKRRTDIDWDSLPAIDEFGMKLVQVRDTIKSEAIRDLLDD